MTGSSIARRWPSAAGPLAGILLLILVNVTFDAIRTGGSGLFAHGSFLHISSRNGAPTGPIIDILHYGAIFVILAIGMAPVIATRGIDLSVGSIMAIAGALAATSSARGNPAAISIGLALGAGLGCGLWNGLLIGGLRLQPFVATLILMVGGRGIAQMITDGLITTFNDPRLEFVASGRLAWLPLPFSFLLTVVLVAITAGWLRWTAVGLFIEAVGGNPEAARLAGIRSRLLIGGTYVFNGLMAGIAGIITVANIKAADPFHIGQNLELAAIFAVVVGGASLNGGRIQLLGAAVGGLLMQTLTTTMYARDVGADVAPLPQALLILAVCIATSAPVRRRLTAGRAQ